MIEVYKAEKSNNLGSTTKTFKLVNDFICEICIN